MFSVREWSGNDRLKLLRPQYSEQQIDNQSNRNDTHYKIFHNVGLLEFCARPGEQHKNQETENCDSYIDNVIHNSLTKLIIGVLVTLRRG